VIVDQLEANVRVVQCSERLLERLERAQDLLDLRRHRRLQELQRVAVLLHPFAELVHRSG